MTFALLLLLAMPLRAEAPAMTEALKARVVGWDLGWKPAGASAWTARVAGEVRAAADEGVDVLVFPELFAWGLAPFRPEGAAAAPYITAEFRERVLPAVGAAAKPGMLVVLGSYPHQEPGWDHAFNRAPVLVDGAWRFVDKIDPTQGEALEEPPIRAGSRLPVFPYKGGEAAVVICFSLEKPEVAAALKPHGVRLVLAPSATDDEVGVARVLRSASARAVELGAAVVVAPLLGEQAGWKNMGSAALYLPAQKGVADPVRESPRRSSGFSRDDFIIPWKALADLRVQTDKPETRPFLSPTGPFEVTR